MEDKQHDQELFFAVARACKDIPGAQVLGFFSKGTEGLHVAYDGKRYLLTIRERPANDGGMTLYEL